MDILKYCLLKAFICKQYLFIRVGTGVKKAKKRSQSQIIVSEVILKVPNSQRRFVFNGEMYIFLE